MPQSNDQYLRWPVPEYHNPERSKTWYILAAIFIFIALFFCFFTFQSWQIVWLGLSSNFLFALFITITIIIMIINGNQAPLTANIELGPEGIKIGQKFYDYDEIKNFAVLYKPKQSVKNLYLEMKSSVHPRVSIPLRRLDALTVRNFLVRYLEENLERTEVPLSEQLTKVLKL